MLNYLKSKGINANDIQDKTGVSAGSISEFKTEKHIIGLSSLEKILLDDVVSDEALDFFIEEFKKLLKHHRNYSYMVHKSADLEDFILGGSQGRKNLSKRDRIITPANFKRQRKIMESIGYKGEKCVDAYLKGLKNEGKIANFDWVSKQNVISPYDFWIIPDGNLKNYMDVKSTSGEFKRKIHISPNELELMTSDTQRYDIYRIFDIDEKNRTAKLRIAEDVRSFAQGIIEVFKGLPEGVCADGISVDPSESGLNFQHEIEIRLPDEPDEELEESEDI
jgi:transcriptional regulator with XRE-family HTH domain